MIENNKTYCGNSLEVLKTFPDNCVDCIITSPPYWQLRNYSTEHQIWGGNPECEHSFGEEQKIVRSGGTNSVKEAGHNSNIRFETSSAFCTKCNAWKGELGLEPTIKLFIDHLIMIFAECKRVLKDEGTMWVNLADTYNTKSGNMTQKEYSPTKNTSMNNSVISKADYTKSKVLKSKSLCNIPSRFRIAMTDELGLIQRNNIIWYKPNCLSAGTILYAKTQKGIQPSTIKDLVRLKPGTVQLFDGKKWQFVKEWARNYNPENIKTITFRNNETITCTGLHLFPLISGDVKAEDLKVGNIVQNTILPKENKDVDFIPDEIGWLIGLYLAEGSLGDKGKCLQFSSHQKETERFERLNAIAKKYDSTCQFFNKLGFSMTINIYSPIIQAIIFKYISGNNAKNKRINNCAWQRSNEFLDNLLHGYLSGDGHYDKPNNRYRLGFTRNNYLARDLRIICARLGYSIKLQKAISKINEVEYKTYKGEIRFTKGSHRNNKSDYEIIKICDGKNAGKFYDIVLENEPHLFSSHSGLLIHNSMPSSATDRFTVDFEDIMFFTKQGKYYFEQQFDKYIKPLDRWGGTALEPNGESSWDIGTGQSAYRERNMRPNENGKNLRTVWEVNTQPSSDKHYAMYPEKLLVRMIEAGCPKEICNECGKARELLVKSESRSNKEKSNADCKTNNDTTGKINRNNFSGDVRDKTTIYSDCNCNAGFHPGIVLDPFSGAGTTGITARKLGRNFINIELHPNNVKITEDRIERKLGTLFQ